MNFLTALKLMKASEITIGRFSAAITAKTLEDAAGILNAFDRVSIKLVQSFYRVKAGQISPVLKEHAVKLLRITSRGTEIYPTMCDFERRDVDRYRVEIDDQGPLANEGFNHAWVQTEITLLFVESGCFKTKVARVRGCGPSHENDLAEKHYAPADHDQTSV